MSPIPGWGDRLGGVRLLAVLSLRAARNICDAPQRGTPGLAVIRGVSGSGSSSQRCGFNRRGVVTQRLNSAASGSHHVGSH